MAEPTLTDIFGAGANQTASLITISKADLAAVGLTASADNTAESLLAAIVLRAKTALTQTTFDSNIDQSITIESGFDSIVQRDTGNSLFANYRQFQQTVSFYQADLAILDPDNL